MKIRKSNKVANHKQKSFYKAKANNTHSVRVLYKKSGQVPTVKIIDNVFKLKKAIVKKNLDIIPYETVYIVCTNKKKQDKNISPNIVLDFYNIKGDLILVDIDKNNREFKGLSQEDIIWYSQDLINKSFNNNTNNNTNSMPKENRQKAFSYYERDFDESNNNTFEKTLLRTLINIELVLASILKNGGIKK